MQKKYYYILDVKAKKGRSQYHFFKIGQADNVSRPTNLERTYTKTTKNLSSVATRIQFDALPQKHDCYITDKSVHKALSPTVLAKVDKNFIEGIFGETDGSDEFFELRDSVIDVVEYVKSVVAELAHNGQGFTGKISSGYALDYKKQPHLVTGKTLDKIIQFGNLKLERDKNKNILLIGQFEPEWIATFAMQNCVTILHDTNDAAHHYTFEALNKNILYILNTDDLQEGIYKSVKFDLIIANPPYGKIGANITKKLIDTVDFDEYVNLLPANDYKRNTEKNLYNYQSDMESIKDGFADAAVTTHLAKIHKSKVNNMTLDEFERSQYIDRQLDKYFEENSKRLMPTEFDTSILNANKTFDVSRTFIIGWRDPVNKHMPYSKNCTTYKWNVEESIDFEYVVTNHLNKANNSVPFGGLIFKSAVEKRNYSNFIYSKYGFRFISKLFTAVQSDMLKTMSTYFTKVDWTRSWTVEEILADYGYTENEIKAVMDDLKNYKGMED